jgi:cytochrome c
MSGRHVRAAVTVLAIAMGGTFATAAFGPAAAAGDAAAGQTVFRTVCSNCHSPLAGTNKTGPSLFGLVGRHTGSVPDYNYSPANKGANITWDAAELDKYLQAPRQVVPGTKMSYAGLKDDAKRANLIAYLETLK